jgi:hypothetical protein
VPVEAAKGDGLATAVTAGAEDGVAALDDETHAVAASKTAENSDKRRTFIRE